MTEIVVPDQDALVTLGVTLTSPQQVNRSRWTGRRKVVGQPGIEYWSGKVAISDIATEEEERPWRAFLFGLGGPSNWFRYPLACNDHPGSNPTVGAGASNAYTLPLAGLTPSTTILAAGQYMTVPLPSGRYRAICLTAPLISDGSGHATAQFAPALGETPSLGVTVESVNPFIPMCPIEDALSIGTDNGVSGIAFDVEENR